MTGLGFQGLRFMVLGCRGLGFRKVSGLRLRGLRCRLGVGVEPVVWRPLFSSHVSLRERIALPICINRR